MKRLILMALTLSMANSPSLVLAGDCPWTIRGAIRSKTDVLKRCGQPDMVNELNPKVSGGTVVGGTVVGGQIVGGSVVGQKITHREQWVYMNSNGSMSIITFSGDKPVDFDTRR